MVMSKLIPIGSEIRLFRNAVYSQSNDVTDHKDVYMKQVEK